MSGTKKSNLLAVFALVFSGGLALAHSGATGVVKERMDMMEDIGKQMKIVGQMIRGQQAFEPVTAKGAAEAIARHAREIPKLFPEGSTDHPSEALPAIWVDWDKFVELSEAMKQEAMVLANAAETATEIAGIREAFSKVGETCSTCHEEFRKAQ